MRVDIHLHVGDLTLHVHHAPGNTPTPGEALIMLAVEAIGNEMTKVADAVGKLTAADTELATEVDELIADLQADQTNTADAVKKALEDAGLDDDTQAAAVDAATAGTQTIIDKIKAVLAPTPPADTGSGGAADGGSGDPATGDPATGADDGGDQSGG